MSTWPDPLPESADGGHRCATCGEGVDPLRAARVRLFADGFRYFCSSDCAETYSPAPLRPRVGQDEPALGLAEPGAQPEPEAQPAPGPGDLARDPRLTVVKRARHGEARPTRGKAEGAAPSPHADETPSVDGAAEVAAAAETTAGQPFPFAAAAAAAAGLSVTLLLARESQATLFVRAGLALVGALFLVFERPRQSHARSPHNRWASAALVGAAALFGLVLTATAAPTASAATTLSGMLLLSTSLSVGLLNKFGRPSELGRRLIAESLADARGPGEAPLQPGQTIMLHAGDRVPADVTIASGQGEALAWPDATSSQAVAAQDNLYAGARLVSGQVQATVRWTGNDAQFARLTLDPKRRADMHAPLVLLAHTIATRGALLALLAAVAVGLLTHLGWIGTGVLSLAVCSVFLNPALSELPAIVTTLTVLRAVGQGIAFRSAASLDAAGRVSTAVFCARGTLLLGEPELSSIDTFGNLAQDEVLALVAGTEQGQLSPGSLAIMRAARARKVQPDAVRSPERQVGLGTTAVASSGAPLVVGSRALMLSHYISIARAEARITELEAMGRDAILVSLNGHLVGILALQDGLAAGARAAVQHLLDVHVEPVLVSGDARKTCEALGRTIDIDHVRPEVLPADRGQEVQRLQSGGAHVAVIGRTPADDLALAQAAVSIVLPSQGFSASDFDIEVADNAVQKASVALALAQSGRQRAQSSLTAMATGIGVALVLLLGLSLPVAIAPLISILSTLTAALLAFGRARRS